MKITPSTPVCSAHFAPGCAVHFVKSPSLTRPEKASRRIVVRRIPQKEPTKAMAPSLKDLCRVQLQDQLSKLYQLELEHASTKQEFSSQLDMYDQLQNKHTESIQKLLH